MGKKQHLTHLIFIIGRVLPAILTFLGIRWYTHLTSPEEYGSYALVFLTATVANLTLFQWLRVSVLRLAPSEKGDPTQLRTTALVGFFVLMGISVMIAFVVAGVLHFITLRWASSNYVFFQGSNIILTVILTWAMAWSDLNLDWLRAKIAPWSYSFLYMSRSIITLLSTLYFLVNGWGAMGLILGSILGAALPGFLFLKNCYAGVNFRKFDRPLLLRMMRYGVPLAATFALSGVVASMDRLMLSYWTDLVIVGIYAATFDLTRNTIFTIMQAVNLASFPMAIKALEKNGEDAARAQLKHNAIILALVSFPTLMGIFFLAKSFSALFLAPQYYQTAILIMPIIAVSAFFNGWRAFYFDQSFQLGKKTGPQLMLMTIGFVCSGLFALIMVPWLGVIGAALNNVVVFFLLLCLSITFGRKIFFLPLPMRDCGKIVLATLLMGVFLSYFVQPLSLLPLLCVILGAGTIYVLTLLYLDILGVRTKILDKV